MTLDEEAQVVVPAHYSALGLRFLRERLGVRHEFVVDLLESAATRCQRRCPPRWPLRSRPHRPRRGDPALLDRYRCGPRCSVPQWRGLGVRWIPQLPTRPATSPGGPRQARPTPGGLGQRAVGGGPPRATGALRAPWRSVAIDRVSKVAGGVARPPRREWCRTTPVMHHGFTPAARWVSRLSNRFQPLDLRIYVPPCLLA